MADYKKLTKIQEEHMNKDIHDLSRKDLHEAWFREDLLNAGYTIPPKVENPYVFQKRFPELH